MIPHIKDGWQYIEGESNKPPRAGPQEHPIYFRRSIEEEVLKRTRGVSAMY